MLSDHDSMQNIILNDVIVGFRVYLVSEEVGNWHIIEETKTTIMKKDAPDCFRSVMDILFSLAPLMIYLAQTLQYTMGIKPIKNWERVALSRFCQMFDLFKEFTHTHQEQYNNYYIYNVKFSELLNLLERGLNWKKFTMLKELTATGEKMLVYNHLSR